MSDEPDLHEIHADVKNLCRAVAELREENRVWREKLMDVLQHISENKKELESVTRRLAALENDVRGLLSFRWWLAGICAAVAVAASKIFDSV